MSPRARAQAVALRHLAERLEEGERELSPELAEAIVHELQVHPEDARAVESELAGDDSHPISDATRAELDRRLANRGNGQPWREAMSEIRADVLK